MANIGYARVSTTDQTHALQTDALNAAGCSRIFQDTISGAKFERKGLESLLEYAREGDTVVVWRLDRLGRSLKDLIEIVQALEARSIGFRSLTESIDTTTPGGKLIFHVFGALAEFEREIIKQGVNAGLASARERGRIGGRPKAATPAKITAVEAMRAAGGSSVDEICKAVGISRATYFRVPR